VTAVHLAHEAEEEFECGPGINTGQRTQGFYSELRLVCAGASIAGAVVIVSMLLFADARYCASSG